MTTRNLQLGGCAVLTLAMILGLSAFPAVAQEEAGALKIRVVDVQKVMDNYDKHEKKVAQMEKDTEEKQAELEKRETQLKADLEAFEEERESLSPADREQRMSELKRRDTLLRSDVNDASELYKRRWARVRQELLKDVILAISQVGAETNCHLILHYDEERTTSVLYYSTPLDITQRVIERVNANYAAEQN